MISIIEDFTFFYDYSVNPVLQIALYYIADSSYCKLEGQSIPIK